MVQWERINLSVQETRDGGSIPGLGSVIAMIISS